MTTINIGKRRFVLSKTYFSERVNEEENKIYNSSKSISYFYDCERLIVVLDNLLFFIEDNKENNYDFPILENEYVEKIFFSNKFQKIILTKNIYYGSDIEKKVEFYKIENGSLFFSGESPLSINSDFYFSEDRFITVFSKNNERFFEVRDIGKESLLYFFTFRRSVSGIIFCKDFLLIKSNWKIYTEDEREVASQIFYCSPSSFCHEGEEVFLTCHLPKNHFQMSLDKEIEEEKYSLDLVSVSNFTKLELDSKERLPRGAHFKIEVHHVKTSPSFSEIIFIFRGTFKIFCLIPSTDEFFDIGYAFDEINIFDFAPTMKQILLPIFNSRDVFPVVYYNS